jgi:hypothetical protein
MTDLLDPPRTRTDRGASPEPVQRPLAVGAAVAGLASAGVVLGALMAVALVGWFASDEGTHGTTRDALRVGTDAWLLGQGAHLHLATGSVATTITAVPLGLTLLSVWVAHRFGRWAARTSAVEDGRTLALGAVVMAGLPAVLALVCALLASTPAAEPGLLSSFVGAFLVTAVGGGSGLLREARHTVRWPALVPEPVRAVALGAVASTLLLAAMAALLLAVALLLDLGSAANVLSRLHAGVAGGALSTVAVAAVAPNAVLLTGSYLLGPGFAVGTGTIVSPGLVTLGPVPAFPLLAALPAEGTPPAWLGALVAAPVLAAVLGTVLVLRRHPALTLSSGALRGLGGGVGGGLLLTLLTALAGGSVGPGRMADVGADLVGTLVASTVAMGVGGLFTGVGATWWARRRA